MHDNVLPIAEALLDRGCLLSGMTAIRIGPGESQQAIHADDGVMTVARPHVPLVVTSMWALTDFTAANGATRVVPGSHLYEGNPDFRNPPATIPVEMRRGSVMIMHGSLWHGGGANTTQSEWRLGVNLQYCAGFVQLRVRASSCVRARSRLDSALARRVGATVSLLGLSARSRAVTSASAAEAASAA